MTLRLFLNTMILESIIIFRMILGTATGDVLEARRDDAGATLTIDRGAGVQESALQRQDVPVPAVDTPGPLSRKQKKDLLKSNVEKIKRDADELVTLTKSLQDEISNSNENVLSVKIIDKAEKIEKLAKQIKNIARGS